MAYVPMRYGQAEEIVNTIRSAIRKSVHRKPSECDLAVPRVLYIYRRRGLVPAFLPLLVLYGVSSQILLEQPSQSKVDESASKRRLAGVLALALYRATHINKTGSSFCQGPTSKEFKLGDSVLAARETAAGPVVKWPPFFSRLHRPCTIGEVNHSR